MVKLHHKLIKKLRCKQMRSKRIMSCKYCGHSIAETAKHCPKCGGEVVPIHKRVLGFGMLIIVVVYIFERLF